MKATICDICKVKPGTTYDLPVAGAFRTSKLDLCDRCCLLVLLTMPIVCAYKTEAVDLLHALRVNFSEFEKDPNVAVRVMVKFLNKAKLDADTCAADIQEKFEEAVIAYNQFTSALWKSINFLAEGKL